MSDKFETVSVEIRMCEKGKEDVRHTVMRHNVTPPEFQILTHIHGGAQNLAVAQDIPVGIAMRKAPNGDDVELTDATEKERLLSWYGRGVFEKIFGDPDTAIMPCTFKDARIKVKIPDNVTSIAAKSNKGKQSKKLSEALNEGVEAKNDGIAANEGNGGDGGEVAL